MNFEIDQVLSHVFFTFIFPPVPGSPTGPGKESIKHKLSTTSCTSSIASHVSSTLQHMHDPNASPVKSIFEGATKYDILHYLEDAKERGLTDVELDEDADDLEEEDGVIEEEDEEEEEDEVINWII